jgi:hypothetical protein
MGHDKLHFEIPAKTKNWCFGLMGLGAISTLVGWFADHSDHHQYWWGVVLICLAHCSSTPYNTPQR